MVNAVVLFVFFVSGIAALIYQIVWQRILTFFGGADVYAVTIIVAAFMAGLGFGSLAGGYLADRLRARAQVVVFGLCEIAVAVFAVVSPVIYYDILYLRLGDLALPRLIMAAIVFAVTLWPTFFMGMSLPLVAKAVTRSARRPARWVPFLYGWNTLGAAVGSLLTVAVLLRTLDFTTSVHVGAALSAFAAAGAFVLTPWVRAREPIGCDGPAPPVDRPSAPVAATAAPVQFALWTWIGIYAVSGFIALSLEIVWFRVLGVILKSNSFTFGHLLAVYLGGVGAGALAGNLPRVAAWPAVPAFLLLQAAIPLAAALPLVGLVHAVDRVAWAAPLWTYMGQYETLGSEEIGPVLAALARGSFSGTRVFVMLYVAVPIWLMAIPTLMMGMSFGHLQRSVQTDIQVLGRRVGWLQAANIGGSLAGALLTGLVLLDWFGSSGTIRLLVCCSAFFGLLLLRTRSHARAWPGVAAIIVAILTIAIVVPPSGLFWARLHAAPPDRVVSAEDASGLSLLKRAASDQVVVYANGLGQSTLPFGGLHTALGALPALLHPNPRAVAVIGLGSGDTLFALGGRREIERIDSIEIVAPQLDTLRRLDQQWFDPGLRRLLRDSRVHHSFTDGRAYLKKGGRSYDIVEADALRPTSAYAGNLYSLEYFELLRDHLRPRGLGVSWAPTGRIRDSFIRAFPHVLLFGSIAIGSSAPLVFDPGTLAERMSDDFTRDYYAAAGIDLPRLLAKYLSTPPIAYGPDFDRSTLADVNRDLFPKDEFAHRSLP